MACAPSRDWDAASYDRVSDPQLEWAREQLTRLKLRGDETVLDAGCGTGRVTALLAERVPRGHLYAVDAAPSMVAHAKAALGERATVLCQDLVELDLPTPVDAIFSNATFHWIDDHDALFAALHGALKPGGALVAQCGGRGNIDGFLTAAQSVGREEPFEPYFTGWRRPGRFATAEETGERLARCGFVDVKCWLQPKSLTPADPNAFVRTVCLVRHLDRLPQTLHDPFVERVLARAGKPLVLEYVRLNMTARRA